MHQKLNIFLWFNLCSIENLVSFCWNEDVNQSQAEYFHHQYQLLLLNPISFWDFAQTVSQVPKHRHPSPEHHHDNPDWRKIIYRRLIFKYLQSWCQITETYSSLASTSHFSFSSNVSFWSFSDWFTFCASWRLGSASSFI